MPLPSHARCLSAAFVLILTACQPSGGQPEATRATPPDAAGTASAAPTAETAPQTLIHPEQWPMQPPPLARDPAQEQRIRELLDRMTLEEKVGQVLQADIGSVTPEEVREYNLGSVLNGGGSAPRGDLRGRPEDWLELADAFWDASTDTSDGGVGIPVIWGTDAVHGHSNVVGATIFPHNIGLGAANDPDLVYEIGRVTALEIAVTGLDWTFAPTLAVVRNDRWGRTYEGYSEDPRIVTAFAPRMVEGLQGRLGTAEFLASGRVIACAKHFVGDGGTMDGDDQGDNRSSEQILREVHAAGYPPAIQAGVQTVMASFNSFHGRKMHGLHEMLTDVLVGRMGFDGFTVGDWNGHGQVAGCSNESCAASFNAGLDMFMVPNDYKALYHSVLQQVRDGDISMARLEEAVSRILRVKLRAGILDAPRPSEREYAGRWELLAAPDHRAVARAAVRQSLVLLKNEARVLPIAPDARVLVAGEAADDIGKQSGGWTLSWQGTGNVNENFPNGESVLDGLRTAIAAGGGEVVYSADGSFEAKPDVAVVVFGENPYAEGVGDRVNVDYTSNDGLNMLRALQEAGIPTVSVFISGRPLWVNPELNASDAFVAAWLPGSEGAGVADVLVAAADGSPRHDFTGRLSFSWPATAAQAEVNVGDADYQPLFPYGFGLAYGDTSSLGELSEDDGLGLEPTVGQVELMAFGDPADGLALVLVDVDGAAQATNGRGSSPGGLLRSEPADDEVQEDTLLLTWTGRGSAALFGQPIDLQGATAAGQVLEMRYRVNDFAGGSVQLSMGAGPGNHGGIEIGDGLAAAAGQGWKTARIRLQCFADQGSPLDAVTEPWLITSDGPLTLQLHYVRLDAGAEGDGCGL